MRRIWTLMISLGGAAQAGAHTLDGEHGLAAAVAHQLAGAHHLPMTILLIAVGGALAGICLRRAYARSDHRQQ